MVASLTNCNMEAIRRVPSGAGARCGCREWPGLVGCGCYRWTDRM